MALPSAETVTSFVVAVVTPTGDGDVDGGKETWIGMYGGVEATDPALPGRDSGLNDADDGTLDAAGLPEPGAIGIAVGVVSA